MEKYLKIITAALAVILAFSSCGKPRQPGIYLYEDTAPATAGTAAPEEDIASAAVTLPPREKNIPEEYEGYAEINPEIAGWLEIASLGVPVVQADNNNKYLTALFDGTESNYSDAVFMDCRCDLESPYNKIFLAYSHNLRSGGGFAELAKYYPWQLSKSGSLDFYEKYPILAYSDFYGSGEPESYGIFAASIALMDDTDTDPYAYDFSACLDISSKAGFAEFMVNMLDRSVFYNPTAGISYEDNIMILSTCLNIIGERYDTRLVIIAKKLSKDDSFDPAGAVINPSPLYFRGYYDITDTEWQGRGWDPETISFER